MARICGSSAARSKTRPGRRSQASAAAVHITQRASAGSPHRSNGSADPARSEAACRNSAADVKRLKELEAENARLKRIVADQVLEVAALKEISKGNW
jgi:hypothetical protein